MSQFQGTGSWWRLFSYMLPWPLRYMYEGEGQRSLVSHIVRTLILWGQNPPLYHHLTSVIPLEATAVNRDTLEATASTQEHEFCENTTLVQHSSSYLQYLAESEIPKEIPCVFFGHSIPGLQVQADTDAEHGLCQIPLCQV